MGVINVPRAPMHPLSALRVNEQTTTAEKLAANVPARALSNVTASTHTQTGLFSYT